MKRRAGRKPISQSLSAYSEIMSAALLQLSESSGCVNRNHFLSFYSGIDMLLRDSQEAFEAFSEVVAGRGDPSQFDPQVRDCACQTRACLILRVLRNPPTQDSIDRFRYLLSARLQSLRSCDYYRTSMQKTEPVVTFLQRHNLTLFDGEDTNRAKIWQFLIVSYILTKYKRSGYHDGVYKDTLERNMPNWRAKLLKHMQEWLSSFSVDFVSKHAPYAQPLMVTKNKLTVLPCYLTAVALANLWSNEPASNPMIMKLSVRRFCQEHSLHSSHDFDFFFAWSAGGVRLLEADEVKDGQQVIQFFSVSVEGDVSVLKRIRETPVASCEEGATHENLTRLEGKAAEPFGHVGAAQGGMPCLFGPTCQDFGDWKARVQEVDFKEAFFTICATHPQYPGTHYSQVAQKWVELCEENAPDMYNSFLASEARKGKIACHRGNLDLFMYEHITAAVHRAS